MTGVALTFGLLVFVYWLSTLASGPQAYAEAQTVLGSTWLKLCYVGWCFCFFYHLANGIRHLAWDLGYGFEAVHISASGWTVVLTALAATLVYGSLVIF
jgi:succinate dehydrogenase / fumarate reductase cytochrome b subunit